MQPKGVLVYIFDSITGKFVPWEGTAAGFGGVTLYTAGGTAVDTSDNGISIETESVPFLGVNALDYGLFGADNVSRTNLLDQSDAQAVGSATGRLAGVASRSQLFNGTTWDRQRSLPSNTDAQVEAQVGLSGVVARNQVFNGATWDRNNSLPSSTDAQVAAQTGLTGIVARSQGFNGTTWDRLRSFAGNADAIVAPTLGLLGHAGFTFAFNGTTYDRVRTNSAATLSATTQPFAMLAAAPGEWAINHTPAANTQATITRAAGAAGVRHICKSISATLIGLAASAETTVLVNLRDGATGAGTILWSARLLVAGTTGNETGISISGLNIFGTAATAMTLEFAAAGGASTFETVALTGYDTV